MAERSDKRPRPRGDGPEAAERGPRAETGAAVGNAGERVSVARATVAARLWRLLGGGSGVGAAVLTGLLLAAAYPSLGAWPLALCGWTPLLLRLRRGDLSLAGAAGLGLLAGTLLHVVVFHWIADTMRDMSGFPMPLAAAVVLLYGAGMGLHQAATAAMVAAHRRSGWRLGLAPVVAALAVLSAEVIVPYQFPWFLGNAFYTAPWLHQAADLIGIWGVSAAAIACSALLAELIAEPARRGRNGVSLAALLALWLGYGALRIEALESTPATRTVRGLLVQHNPSLREKKAESPKPRLPMLARAKALTQKAELEEVDLIVWSEGALPFFYVPSEVDGRAPDAKPIGRANALLRGMTREIDALAEELGKPMIVGTLRRLDPDWRERARNAALVLVPGRPRAFYDKQRLVPFGEYMPGRDLVPALAESIPGISDIGAGEGAAVFDVGVARAGLSICYENLFPALVHDLHRDAEVLINLTDDVWFGRSNAPELHLMVQAARAVELRRPLWRATATGHTAAIDAAGRVVARAPWFSATTLKVEAEVREMGSPFRLWGVWPAWLLALAGVALVGWCWRRAR